MSTDNTATTDKSIPTDPEGNPISWDGNNAKILGIISEFGEWSTRTGMYVPLIEN